MWCHVSTCLWTPWSAGSSSATCWYPRPFRDPKPWSAGRRRCRLAGLLLCSGEPITINELLMYYYCLLFSIPCFYWFIYLYTQSSISQTKKGEELSRDHKYPGIENVCFWNYGWRSASNKVISFSEMKYYIHIPMSSHSLKLRRNWVKEYQMWKTAIPKLLHMRKFPNTSFEFSWFPM